MAINDLVFQWLTRHLVRVEWYFCFIASSLSQSCSGGGGVVSGIQSWWCRRGSASEWPFLKAVLAAYAPVLWSVTSKGGELIVYILFWMIFTYISLLTKGVAVIIAENVISVCNYGWFPLWLLVGFMLSQFNCNKSSLCRSIVIQLVRSQRWWARQNVCHFKSIKANRSVVSSCFISILVLPLSFVRIIHAHERHT